jgi:hypothetical protein
LATLQGHLLPYLNRQMDAQTRFVATARALRVGIGPSLEGRPEGIYSIGLRRILATADQDLPAGILRVPADPMFQGDCQESAPQRGPKAAGRGEEGRGDFEIGLLQSQDAAIGDVLQGCVVREEGGIAGAL